MSPDLQQARQRIEAKIEEMIALLDLLDGDPDFEPYLAGVDPSRVGSGDDREGDDSDLEPSCGWTNSGAYGFGYEEEEHNGDEHDFSGYQGEFLGLCGNDFDGSGVFIAEKMIRDLRRKRRVCQ